MKALVSVIAAIAKNRALGKSNKLPWYLPEDLKRFKKLTLGHPVIMGRKTYQSIGQPLPARTNIVVTRNPNFKAPGCLIVRSLEEAVRVAKKKDRKKIFIIGGASVYRQALALADRIYLTRIRQNFPGDVFFPQIKASDWQLVSCQSFPKDSQNSYPYDFCLFKKKA